MTVRLNLKLFFNDYIINPSSVNLTPQDRKVALVASILLGVLFAGIPQLIACIYQKINNNPKNISKTNETAIQHFNNPTAAIPQKKPAWASAHMNELARRITEAEHKNISALLAELPELEVRKFVDIFTKKTWDANSLDFQNPKNLLYALKAFEMQWLSDEQFATVCLFMASPARHRDSKGPLGNKRPLDSKPICMPLFQADGSPAEDAKALIAETLTIYTDTTKKLLTDDQLRQFFENMKKLPPSEQQFLVIGDSYQFGGFSIASNIFLARSLQVFGCIVVKEDDYPTIRPLVEESRGKVRLVPSGGMMQSLLLTMNPKHAVKMNFVLGSSDLSDMQKNGLEGTRDVGLPFGTYAAIPKMADGLKAEDIDFTYHDFYHSIVVSCIPDAHRKLFMEAVDLFKKGVHKKKFGALRFRLRDLEALFYLPYKTRFANVDKFPKYLTLQLPISKEGDAAFWVALDAITHFIEDNETIEAALKILVDHFAIKQKGLEKGVSAKGLEEAYQAICELRKQNPKYANIEPTACEKMWKIYKSSC